MPRPSGSACSTFSTASVRVFTSPLDRLPVPSPRQSLRSPDPLHAPPSCVRPSFILVIRAMRVLPNPVRSFARALAVQFGQIFPSRRLNPGGFRQLHQKLFIPLLAVPAHDAAQMAAFASSVVAGCRPSCPANFRFSTQSKTASCRSRLGRSWSDQPAERVRNSSQCQRISCSPGYSSSDPIPSK